ncbi:MAG: glycosyltransferase family 2 protein [Bacteroidia bacterium]
MTTNFPKISIVTPSFNQGEFLEETILSVLEQNYPNLEYIVMDGGSTDNSVEIIKKYASKINFWKSEKDGGLYDALNKGFAKCSGEIMAWINSDDVYHQKSFFTVAEIFSSFSDVKWIQGMPTSIDESGRIISVGNFRKWSKYNYFLKEYQWIQQESCFWRKELWNKSGAKMNSFLQLAGDLDLWLRFFDHAELYSVNTVLGCFRLKSKNQLSLERAAEYEKEANTILNERIKKTNSEEKMQLEKLFFYRDIYSKIPFLKTKMYTHYLNNFQYPSTISFDRISQSFKMDLKK